MTSEQALLYLDALPPNTKRGTIVRLLTQLVGLPKDRVGKIEIRGRTANIEIPSRFLDSAVAKIDGSRLGDQHIRAWHNTKKKTAAEEDHFQRLGRWLELEADAEAEQLRETLTRLPGDEAERAGVSLLDLRIVDSDSGLGGRRLLTFQKKGRDGHLPWTRLGVGSPVLANQSADKSRSRRGVICYRGARRLQVAFDDWDEVEDDATFRLDLASDEIARKRQRAALDRARGAQGDRLAELCRVLVKGRTPDVLPPPDLSFESKELNQSQREAVAHAMAARDVAIIHGPPGTGKTTTVVELLRQAVETGETVLACAPSNLGVDNLMEKLVAAGTNAVRIGHPARVLPAIRERTLDMLVEADPDVRLARKYARQAHALRDKANRYTRAKPEPGARREMRTEARQLLDDANRIERQVIQQILNRAQVICSTTTALNSELLGQRRFDLAVIDEACQSTEPGCWIPLLRAERLVLAGDHCQLPPTVISAIAKREGFDESLQQRLLKLHGAAIARRLDVQYRMHERIMRFSSQQFYDGELTADDSVAAHTLAELPDTTDDHRLGNPLVFVDTAAAGYDEEREEKGESLRNPREAELVTTITNCLSGWGVPENAIGVITPYAAQVRLLRKMITGEAIEVDTVDGFQGREKEAIVISLVRSNQKSQVGFLRDVRRMNVAMTRARRMLIVVGDSATIGGHPFYQEMLDYFERQGVYGTVWDDTLFS